MAQDSDKPEMPSELQEIRVTGSRVARSANDAPTPVTTIGQEEIRAQSPANIADFVNMLPSVRGSSTATNSAGALSNGAAGISALNLRSLGTGRTLVLLDGQRSVISATTGVVDTNTFPQSLIQRVEVATGGASSRLWVGRGRRCRQLHPQQGIHGLRDDARLRRRRPMATPATGSTR